MAKKALIIGINYTGTVSELSGCINDAQSVKQELIARGYEDITVMTDITELKPTRENIFRELISLISSPAKQLYFHYSGHGSQLKDDSMDESDGKDECIIPLDYQKSGYIIDDEIRGLLSCLRKTQSMFCVLDCCNSGSGMDLTYNLYKRYGTGKLVMKDDGKTLRTKGKCIMLSGCQDHQTSADAYIDGKYQGALTHAFLMSLKYSLTYKDLIENIREKLEKAVFSQYPNLSSGRRLSLSSSIDI